MYRRTSLVFNRSVQHLGAGHVIIRICKNSYTFMSQRVNFVGAGKNPKHQLGGEGIAGRNADRDK